MYVVSVVSELYLAVGQEGQLSFLLGDVRALPDIRQDKRKVCFQDLSDIPFVQRSYDVAYLGFLAIEGEVEGLDAEFVHYSAYDVLSVREFHHADTGHLLTSDLHQQVILSALVLRQTGCQTT